MPQLDEPTPQNMTIPGWEGYVPDARVFAEFEPQTSPASPSQKPPCARFDWPARNAPPIGHKSDRPSLVGRPDRRRVAGPGSRESRGNFHFSPQRSRLSLAADQTAELVLIGVTLARHEMVEQLCPRASPPCPGLGRRLPQQDSECGVGWFRQWHGSPGFP